MTPENFVYWLKGILEDNETNKLEPKKFKKIKEKLAKVTGETQAAESVPQVKSNTTPWSIYDGWNTINRGWGGPIAPLYEVATTKPLRIYAPDLIKPEPVAPVTNEGETV